MRHHIIADIQSDKKYALLFIFISTILLYFIFSSAVNFLYYAGDDSRYAFGEFRKACKHDDGFEYMLTLGRPLQAYMDCAVFKIANTVEKMRMIRFFSVFLMACALSLFAQRLIKLGFSLIPAFFAAGSLMLTPNLAYDSVLTGAISLPFALVFALLAYIFIDQYHSYNYSNSLISKNKNYLYLFSAGGFLLCSMLTYPAMSFFFATLILAKLLFSNFSNWGKTRKEILRETVLFCLICTIYFFWAYCNMHYFALTPISDNYHVDRPNFNLMEIIARLAILGNIFHPIWENTVIKGWVAISFLLCGVLAGIICFVKSELFFQNKKQAFTTLFQMSVLALALIILCSSFFLLIPNRDTGGRLLFGSTGAGFLLVFWCVIRCSEIMPKNLKSKLTLLVFGIFFTVSGYMASTLTTVAALAYVDYIHLVKDKLSNYYSQAAKLQRIHFIIPKSEYPYNKFFLTNQALRRIMDRDQYKLRWCSLARGVPGSEQDHQDEMISCLRKLPNNGIAVTYSYPKEHFKKTDSMLIIDMHDISFPILMSENQHRYLSI